MSSMSTNQSEDKESSYVAVRLLSGLKEAYTFKELEELLNIPAQVLWRYTSHVQFPEKSTARKLLDAIQEKHLLERAMRELIINSQGLAEDWRLLYNPRFLNIVGYLAWRHFGGDNVDLVIAPSERDSALATIVADWLGADSCIATEHAWASWGKLLVSSYVSSERGRVIYIHVPKEAIEKGSRILIVRGTTRNFESLPALASIVEQAKGVLVGAFIVLAHTENWMESIAKVGLRKVKVLIQKTVKSYEVTL